MRLISTFLTGCISSPKPNIYGVSERYKSAGLEYTKIGITSEFKFKGIATGTYKSIGHEGGVVVHAGTQNIKLTVNAREKWSIKAESKRQSFHAKGLGIRLHNPYVGTVKKGKKTIGTIGISMPKIDKAKETLKFVGLDSFIDRNLHLTGKANILGKSYKISSVYKDASGKKHGSPQGYRVTKNNKTMGVIQVGKNMVGGQVLQMWITPGLAPLVEQSVVSTLLVCGYAV